MDLKQHQNECARSRKEVCGLCGDEVELDKMAAHRADCSPSECPRCGERCIMKLHPYCPKVETDDGTLRDSFEKITGKMDHSKSIDSMVEKILSLYRLIKFKNAIDEAIFRKMHKEIESKEYNLACFRNRSYFKRNQHLRSTTIRKTINGPDASAELTPVELKNLLDNVQGGSLPTTDDLKRILWRASKELRERKTVAYLDPVAMDTTKGGNSGTGYKINIVGDLHGQLKDLRRILEIQRPPCPGNYYIFNGDFVDRSSNGVEVLLTLLLLFLLHKEYVFLNRGNHECRLMNKEYGFLDEFSLKYPDVQFSEVTNLFSAFPLATIVRREFFVVHGGIPRREGATIEEIEKLSRERYNLVDQTEGDWRQEMMQDLLWSDPVDNFDGWRRNERGTGVEFGESHTNKFLENNHLKLVIRSHEECPLGYKCQHSGKVYTVFSCSNYSELGRNKGATCVISANCDTPTFYQHDVNQSSTNEIGELNNMSFADDAAVLLSSSTSNRRHFKPIVLRQICELVFELRHRLLINFSEKDRTKKGSLWTMEWTTVMGTTLTLNLPWYFLCSFLTRVEDYRILYSRFINGVQTPFQAIVTKDMEQEVCFTVKNKIPPELQSEFLKSMEDKKMIYTEFCKALENSGVGISEVELFQLFQFFDKGQGFVEGSKVADKLRRIGERPRISGAWNPEEVDQFLQCTIRRRKQLMKVFKVISVEIPLSEEEFEKGINELTRREKVKISSDKIRALYTELRCNPNSPVTLEMFLLFMHFCRDGIAPSAFMKAIKKAPFTRRNLM